LEAKASSNRGQFEIVKPCIRRPAVSFLSCFAR
jgi:hypothetical protein